MAELQNTRSRIDQFFREKRRLLSGVYNASQCSSVQQLRTLMEDESILLLGIQNEITDELRKCCYEGMLADGMKHPEVPWAIHIGSRYTPIFFPTIRSEVVQEELYKAQQTARQQVRQNAPEVHADSADQQNRKLLGCGSSVIGIGCAVAGCVMNPMSVWLLALGIVMTATGAVVLLSGKEADREHVQQVVIQPENSKASPVAPDEGAVVHMILNEQVERCTRILKDYCDQAYRYACEAVQKEAGEGSGEDAQ